MAKALVGYLGNDIRNPHLLAVENSRLRARVQELQDLVLQLKEENDALAARAAELVPDRFDASDLQEQLGQEMQPV